MALSGKELETARSVWLSLVFHVCYSFWASWVVVAAARCCFWRAPGISNTPRIVSPRGNSAKWHSTWLSPGSFPTFNTSPCFFHIPLISLQRTFDGPAWGWVGKGSVWFCLFRAFFSFLVRAFLPSYLSTLNPERFWPQAEKIGRCILSSSMELLQLASLWGCTCMHLLIQRTRLWTNRVAWRGWGRHEETSANTNQISNPECPLVSFSLSLPTYLSTCRSLGPPNYHRRIPPM